MKITHKTAPFDHYEPEPDVDKTNNIIIGIAMGVMITICAGILWFVSLIEAVNY